MNKIIRRPSPGSISLDDAANEGVRHMHRATLALMRGQRALKLLEAKADEAEEAAARVKSPRANTVEERIRRANEIAGNAPPRPKFKSLTENIAAIFVAENGGPVDARLERAPAGASGSDGPSGGWLLEDYYSQQITGLAYEGAILPAMCDWRPTSKPLSATKIPGIDETSRADGSRFGGAIAWWAGEGTAPPTASLPRFKNIEMQTKKIIALLFGTDELMSDAPFYEATIKRALIAEFGFKLDLGVLSGTGVGQPLGILNSSSLITVPKETGQVSGTVVRENVNKMWKRLPAPSRYEAVWLANEDMDEQLEALNGNPGTYVNPSTYIPAGANGNVFPLLKGRPVLTIEQCPAVGTVGDLVLADLSKYVILDGGMNSAISLHVRFDSDQALLRFTMRVDGRPSFTTPISPYNGTLTRSPFVALGSR
jgi:HK97 family phage major capsid protein